MSSSRWEFARAYCAAAWISVLAIALINSSLKRRISRSLLKGAVGAISLAPPLQLDCQMSKLKNNRPSFNLLVLAAIGERGLTNAN